MNGVLMPDDQTISSRSLNIVVMSTMANSRKQLNVLNSCRRSLWLLSRRTVQDQSRCVGFSSYFHTQGFVGLSHPGKLVRSSTLRQYVDISYREHRTCSV